MATAIAEPPHLATDLKTLYLSMVASQWRPLAEQAPCQRQAPADYLAQLMHLEVPGRPERRIQRRIQDARFPMPKTLDAFSFEAQPDLDRDTVLQVFHHCRFAADAANVVFVVVACCQHDYRVRLVAAAKLVTLPAHAQQQGRLSCKLAELTRFDAVIVNKFARRRRLRLNAKGAVLTIIGLLPPPVTSVAPSAEYPRSVASADHTVAARGGTRAKRAREGAIP